MSNGTMPRRPTWVRHGLEETPALRVLVEAVELLARAGEQPPADGMNDGVGCGSCPISASRKVIRLDARGVLGFVRCRMWMGGKKYMASSRRSRTGRAEIIRRVRGLNRRTHHT